MSRVTVLCDGCDTPTDSDEITSFGEINVTTYCKKCTPSVKNFLKGRDALHEKVAETFEKGLSKLKSTWEKTHPSGRLPDV